MGPHLGAGMCASFASSAPAGCRCTTAACASLQLTPNPTHHHELGCGRAALDCLSSLPRLAPEPAPCYAMWQVLLASPLFDPPHSAWHMLLANPLFDALRCAVCRCCWPTQCLTRPRRPRC